jgi:hypothetical protein
MGTDKSIRMKAVPHLKMSPLPHKLPVRPVKAMQEPQSAYLSLFRDRPSPSHCRSHASHYSDENRKDVE